MKWVLFLITIVHAAQFDIDYMAEKLRKKIGEGRGIVVRQVPPNILIEGEVSVVQREAIYKVIDKYQPKPPQIFSDLKIKPKELEETARRMQDRIAQKDVHVYYDNGVFVVTGHARSEKAAREAAEIANLYAVDPQDSHSMHASKHEIVRNELR